MPKSSQTDPKSSPASFSGKKTRAPRKRIGREYFPAQFRVKKRREFLAIQATRQKVRSNTLLFAIVRKDQPVPPSQTASASQTSSAQYSAGQNMLPVCRIGLTVTTKVHKRAVRRNRLKRHLREVFRKDRRFLLYPADIVVIALEGAVDLNFQDVRSEFRFAMRKAGLLPYRQKNP